jgi:hypothetical protein
METGTSSKRNRPPIFLGSAAQLSECSNNLMTILAILAMSLSLGSSWANKPAGSNRVGELRLTQQVQTGGEGMKAANDRDGHQVPVQEPGKADREKQPVLVAPHCSVCRQSDLISPWQQFQLFLSRIYWI